MTDKPKLKHDWHGRYVRLLLPHETKGGAIFEAGEVMLVTRNFGGLQLESVRACDTCRRKHRHRITKVSEHHVHLLPKECVPND